MILESLAAMHEVARYVRPEKVPCSECNGSGMIIRMGLVTAYTISPPEVEETCDACRGTGVDPEEGDEPMRVPCSYPNCERLTTVDPVYGDLCFRHIRAENE